MHDAPPLGGHGWPGRLLWVARRAANNNLPPAMAHRFPRVVAGGVGCVGGIVCVFLALWLVRNMLRSMVWFRLRASLLLP